MGDFPITLYVLQKEFSHSSLPLKECTSQDSSAFEVFHMVSTFTTWLRTEICNLGFVIQGPYQSIDTGWSVDYVICLYRPWPKIATITDCQYRNTNGEIFVSTDDVFYVSTEGLLPLQSEVLVDFYSDEHGRQVGELEADLRRRLKKTCLAECHALGYNRAAASNIAAGMVEELICLSLNSWTWKGVQEAILRHAEAYAKDRRRPYMWMVREQLATESVDALAEPIEDGDLVLRVIPAMHSRDLVKEWLLEAQPLLKSLRLPTPELDNVRLLQPGELFFSERGLMHRFEGSTVWLGEIATDLLHERHGECLTDADSLVREEVVRLLLSEVENKHSLMADQYAEAVDAAHELAAKTDVLHLWYRDIAGLVEQLCKKMSF